MAETYFSDQVTTETEHCHILVRNPFLLFCFSFVSYLLQFYFLLELKIIDKGEITFDYSITVSCRQIFTMPNHMFSVQTN